MGGALSPRSPKALITALSNLRRRAIAEEHAGESNRATPLAFGLLTGLLPCAPLQGAQIAAAASGSSAAGAAGMMAFALGTMPLLLVFGTTAVASRRLGSTGSTWAWLSS